MRPVILPPGNDRHPLAFYLAEEEWIAGNTPEGDYFFMWQVEPSVICGRNQLIDREINVDFCHSHGVRLFRRKSGGGAVVADRNNLMLSLVTSAGGPVAATFRHYTSAVADSLRKLGLDASDNSRNDILIGSRKVSGNSYYHTGRRSIVHGTMLYDYDPRLMEGVLTPPASKLQSHGVSSVRSRITTIREHLPAMSIDEFRTHLMDTIPDGECLMLTPENVMEIEALEQSYYLPSWLEGKNPPGTLRSSGRIEGVGELSVYIALKAGVISDLSLRGDFMETSDASARLLEALRGVPLRPDAVMQALKDIDMPGLVTGLTTGAFVRSLFEEKTND